MSACLPGGFTLTKRGRFWAVRDKAGCLVCLTVYKKGGREVIRRLGMAENAATGSTEQENVSPAPVSVRLSSRKPSRAAYAVRVP